MLLKIDPRSCRVERIREGLAPVEHERRLARAVRRVRRGGAVRALARLVTGTEELLDAAARHLSVSQSVSRSVGQSVLLDSIPRFNEAPKA